MKTVGTGGITLALLLFSSLGSAHDAAPTEADPGTIITPLLEQALAPRSAAVASMVTVEYAPGAATPPHTHPADTFVYVLSGAVEMQVEGGAARILRPGDTYYEKPTDKHILSRNASADEPAKFLVFFVKEPGAPVLEPLAHE